MKKYKSVHILFLKLYKIQTWNVDLDPVLPRKYHYILCLVNWMKQLFFKQKKLLSRLVWPCMEKNRPSSHITCHSTYGTMNSFTVVLFHLISKRKKKKSLVIETHPAWEEKIPGSTYKKAYVLEVSNTIEKNQSKWLLSAKLLIPPSLLPSHLQPQIS